MTLPEKVYPDVQIDRGLEYSTPTGVMYGNGCTSCKRVFKITDYCEYTEYLESYSGKSFYLVNADLKISTFEEVFTNQILENYPDMVDIKELSNINKVPDFKRVMREDLYKPLVRKDIKVSKIEEMVNSQSNNINSNHKELDRLFNMINDLSRKVSKLEADNVVLKQQINDLIVGQVPKELSSNILENMFEE